MHKVFITYHHKNDQFYQDQLLRINELQRIFIDRSVDTGDISDDLRGQTIRHTIRDDYLQDSTVTILLVGTETKNRKHIDWELYSSMIDGTVNKKSGILVVTLPSTGCKVATAGHGLDEKAQIHPEINDWVSIDTRAEYQNRYPYMPERIIDNLLIGTAFISVVPWEKATEPDNLRYLIEATFNDRHKCEYDFSSPMKRRNSSSSIPGATPSFND